MYFNSYVSVYKNGLQGEQIILFKFVVAADRDTVLLVCSGSALSILQPLFGEQILHLACSAISQISPCRSPAA